MDISWWRTPYSFWELISSSRFNFSGEMSGGVPKYRIISRIDCSPFEKRFSQRAVSSANQSVIPAQSAASIDSLTIETYRPSNYIGNPHLPSQKCLILAKIGTYLGCSRWRSCDNSGIACHSKCKDRLVPQESPRKQLDDH